MNSAIVIALVLTACCGRLVVRASIVDRGYSYGPHSGGHFWGGHGPKYRKISLIGGSGGGGLLYPTATASIASTASVSVPKLLHDHHRRPAQATYCSRSGPGVYGSHHVGGNHHHGPTVVHCKNQLLGKLLAKKSTGLDGGRNCAGGCGGGKEAKIGGGGCHGRLRLVGPVCCGSCGGYGGVHY